MEEKQLKKNKKISNWDKSKEERTNWAPDAECSLSPSSSPFSLQNSTQLQVPWRRQQKDEANTPSEHGAAGGRFIYATEPPHLIRHNTLQRTHTHTHTSQFIMLVRTLHWHPFISWRLSLTSATWKPDVLFSQDSLVFLASFRSFFPIMLVSVQSPQFSSRVNWFTCPG